MELRLYNTLTKEKEVFAPLDPARGVRMYVCGPTVYDFAHIGNARPVIVFDVLYRLLRHLYGENKVKYVRNITDVDDKINARAAQEYPDLALNEAIRLVTEKTEKQFHDDVDALGCLRPDVEPRATEHIGEMRELIERLVKAGFAYVEQDHVLFEVGKMADYGTLARRSLDEMEAGARVEVAPYKRNPMDFVLWKPSKQNEPGWPSPSGIKTPGRPGWHIECSAMSWKHLGETFDIHGGGIDLVFPHHENEIAQSRCAFHAPVMAKTWMHNGFLQVEGEKMSKSLGNFVTIRELLNDWPGEVIRFNMLKTHYRQPIDWTVKGLEESSKTIDEWYDKVGDAEPSLPMENLVASLMDDLNTPQTIAELHRIAAMTSSDSAVAVTRNGKVQFEKASGILKASGMMLGLFRQTNSHRKSELEKAAGIDPKAIDELIDARLAARKSKNFAESDRIRDELKAMGVVIKDNKDGTTTWEIAR
jgi:cysteinyl-tRNA synthetase